MKKVFYKRWWFWLIIVILIMGSWGRGCDNSTTTDTNTASPSPTFVSTTTPSPTPSPTPTPTPSPTPVKEKSGIIPDKFETAVRTAIAAINSKNTGMGVLQVEVDVTGATAHVKVYFTDLSIWSKSNDTYKKEFINTLGNGMDTIATENTYSKEDTVGVNTKLYSPSKLELGERTVFGSVKLK